MRRRNILVSRSAAMRQPCRYCGAKPGHTCTRVNGKARAQQHVERHSRATLRG